MEIGSKTSWLDGLSATLRMANIPMLIGVWAIYRVALALYNISPFHPLYRIPGPKLAAMSFIYEFWYEFVLFGRYTREIERMHKVYGPVVRINPEELHCIDPEFYDEIYAGGGRVRDKQQHYLNVNAGAASLSTFNSTDHETHRIRRSAMNRFFSRAQMIKLEPEIHVCAPVMTAQTLAQHLCEKMLLWTSEPLDLGVAYSCFTSDTISQYAYGEPLGFLAQDGWDKNYKSAIDGFLATIYVFRYFPWTRGIVPIAPYFARFMSPELAIFFRELTDVIPGHVRRAAQGQAKGRIFSDVIDSPLPDSEKTIHRLSGEGFSFTSAGTETTAAALTFITYHLLAKPDMQARLAEALAESNVDPENLSWTSLEKCPYMYAVISEGLRLSYGVSQRSPRIARAENLVYRDQERRYEYVIPKGTAIGMSCRLVHHDEKIFPRSHEYLPERWLDETGQPNYRLEKYLVSFSKGSRQCIGMNLALCEIYLAIAAVTLRVLPRMKIHETSKEDLEYDYDVMVPRPKKGSRPVKVTISNA